MSSMKPIPLAVPYPNVVSPVPATSPKQAGAPPSVPNTQATKADAKPALVSDPSAWKQVLANAFKTPDGKALTILSTPGEDASKVCAFSWSPPDFFAFVDTKRADFVKEQVEQVELFVDNEIDSWEMLRAGNRTVRFGASAQSGEAPKPTS
jgi:hypothetical protein